MAELTPSVVETLRETLRDTLRALAKPEERAADRRMLGVLARATVRALPALYLAQGDRDTCLIKRVLENAAAAPYALAFELDEERLTWAALAERTSRLAYVLAFHGVVEDDVVALIGTSSPSYVAFALGVSRLGATAALINHHLEGKPLAHAVATSKARVAVVEVELLGSLLGSPEALAALDALLVYRRFGASRTEPLVTPEQAALLGKKLVDLDAALANAPEEPFPRVTVRAESDYLYIYTSGTTGLPKPCRVTHGRAVVGGAAYGLFFDYQPGDKLYSVLPLYHSSAMLIGVGSAIMTRTPMAMRRQFSASSFWSDVQKYRATHMLYIGEICRYLLNTPPCEAERENPLRMALGNGMRADLWETFQARFRVPEIREFYAATEAPGLIINLSGKPGSIGKVPLRRLLPMKLVRYDVETDTHPRDAAGFYVECGPGEVGEFIALLDPDKQDAARSFKGYTDEAATEHKILTDVFERGDRYYRSGDLLRYDEDGYFYFVDRIGDTYRWKGENVSTAEVAEVISRAPGVLEATVCGVRVPGMEGQAGLAALVCEADFDAEGFWRTVSELPRYAQPRFVRLLPGLRTTGTFKVQKSYLKTEGVDPSVVLDDLYVRTGGGYVPLTPELWAEIVDGRLSL